LKNVKFSMTKISAPFGVAAAPGGQWDLVAGGSGIEVFRNTGALSPRLARTLPMSRGLGVSLTPDGKYLLVADDGVGADVIDVAKAEQGQPGALVGRLTGPSHGGGAIETAVSADGKFAFVSIEYGQAVAVYNLRRALTRGFGPADFVGFIPAGQAVVGMAVSPNGRWLYFTSEAGSLTAACHGKPPIGYIGTLTVVSVGKAETDPAKSVGATVRAGGEPVRVITSADGSVVWVTARSSDALLGFSAARLVSDPAKALIADVPVGEAPVGLALVRNGTRIVVADSNRFDASGAKATLAVVNVAAALTGRPALLGYVPAGLFPREMALVAGGRTLLVGNFVSGQLEAVDVPSLP
jgi:DNA-binding beta-propeller fold protein YncE